jgi:hypothetical protein
VGKIMVYRDSQLTLFSKDISAVHINGEKIKPIEINGSNAKINLMEGKYDITIHLPPKRSHK